MTPERFEQVKALFEAAMELPAADRAAFLDRTCEGDEELRREVESLVVSRPGLLDAPVPKLTGEPAVTEVVVGSQLGPYRIEGLAGAGGMGRVYQALDTRLGRKVAIKISTTEFTDRFQREARAIAAVNHPHICTLHDVGPNFLVMELVEGETLAARLKKGKLSIEDTLRYGGQIAGALAEAHAKGVTHRDLKPGNIMITKSGVKVLDFGLAKVEGEDLTKSNATMGTPGYMAPEQLEGKGTDARTDVYALGLVLREMATGKREAGEEPLPPQFAHIVGRSLAPEPEQRWQAASDVRAELEWAAKAQPAALVSKPNRTWQWITAACLLLVAVVVIVQFRQAHQADQSAYRLELQPPENGRFVVNAIDGGIALSPDGKSAAYVAEQSGKTGLWIRPLEGTTARLLPGTEGASFPFWSPNNQSVGFFVGSRLLWSDVSGGRPLPVSDVPSGPRGGAWSNDGRTIVFGTTAVGLWQVPAAGGIASPLVGSESSGGDLILEWPQTLPGGRLLYWAYDAKRPENAGVFVTSFAKPAERTRLMAADASALYARGAGGRHYLMWLRGSAVVAQEINLATLKLTGEPSLVADPVGALQAVGRMNAAASSTGVLLYENGGVRMAASRLTWLDRSGKPLGTIGEPGPYLNFRVSPDGSRVAVARDNSSKGADLWLFEVERGVATRFTSNPGVTFFPVWSPDGQTIVFGSSPQHLIRKPANGAGSQQSLTEPGVLQNPLDWSRDGSYILYRKVGRDTLGDLWYLPVNPKGEPTGDPKLYLGTRYDEFHARFSPEPNPRWVAYESDESGRIEVYVQAFPEPRGARRISTAGGRYPQWNGQGRELFYVSPENKLMAVDLKVTRDALEPSAPHELFPVMPTTRLQVPYDAAPDGHRFLVLAPVQQAQQPLHVIVNWPALLKGGSAAP